MDIVEFLTARLDEDEQIAREATGDPWVIGSDRDYRFARIGDVYAIDATAGTPALIAHGHACGPDVSATQTAVHIVRHDPARVLADVEAKRAVIDIHSAPRLLATSFSRACMGCGHIATGENAGQPVVIDRNECPTLRALVGAYADHSDFDPSWKLA